MQRHKVRHHAHGETVLLHTAKLHPGARYNRRTVSVVDEFAAILARVTSTNNAGRFLFNLAALASPGQCERK